MRSEYLKKVVCGNSLRIRGKRCEGGGEYVSRCSGVRKFSSLSLSLSLSLSFLRAAAGNELVGKSVVTLPTSEDFHGLLTRTIRASAFAAYMAFAADSNSIDTGLPGLNAIWNAPVTLSRSDLPTTSCTF